MKTTRRGVSALVATAAAGCLGAVSGPGADRRGTDGTTGSADGTSNGSESRGQVTVAIGTTVYDTGVADEIARAVEDAAGIEVRSVPRGTGGALRMIRSGDVDAAVVHHPSAEREVVADGDAVGREPVMYNDFLLAGPPDDPAAAADGTDVVDALERIAADEVPFLSRGDDSGTHARERELWATASADPAGEWYRESGSGMGETLRVAAMTGAYTLTDRGTYRVAGADLDLEPAYGSGLDDPDGALLNRYSVLRTAPDRHSEVETDAAVEYVDVVTGSRGQRVIAEYRPDGEPLFLPASKSN